MKKLILLFSIPAIAALLAVSCTTDSADTASPVPSFNREIINVSGVYRNSESNENFGVFINPPNSGQSISFMNIRQNGSDLEGIVDGNQIFRGTIGAVQNSAATFNLEGFTSSGSKATLSGSIAVGSNKGTMRASWIESDRICTVYGVADGPTSIRPPVTTNGNTNVTINLQTPRNSSYQKHKNETTKLDQIKLSSFSSMLIIGQNSLQLFYFQRNRPEALA